MKNTSIRLVLTIVFATILLGACKKDKDSQVTVTAESLAGTYKLTSAKADLSGQTVDLKQEYMEDCQLDDTYTLNADYSAVLNDAGTKCDPDGSGETSWELTNGKEITVYTTDLTVEGTITSYTGKELVIKDTSDFFGVPYYATYVLNKQ